MMKIRNYHDSDWRRLHALYNRYLQADRVTPEFFLEHLIMSPNFDPAGVKLLEENGEVTGAVVAQVVTRNLNPWVDQVKSAAATGYLMPLMTDRLEAGKLLLAEAEQYFRDRHKTTVRAASLGPTLFPDAIDSQRYPVIHQVLAESGYQAIGNYYSMRCDLETYRPSPDILAKQATLAAAGITARTCTLDEVPKVRRFLESGDLIGRIANLNEKLHQNALHEAVIIGSEDEILGYCQYNYYHQTERVGPFGVTSARRGQGIGQVMVAKLLEVMAEHSYQCAYFVSCNESNVHFYRKNQFEVYRTKTIFTKNL